MTSHLLTGGCNPFNMKSIITGRINSYLRADRLVYPMDAKSFFYEFFLTKKEGNKLKMVELLHIHLNTAKDPMKPQQKQATKFTNVNFQEIFL